MQVRLTMVLLAAAVFWAGAGTAVAVQPAAPWDSQLPGSAAWQHEVISNLTDTGVYADREEGLILGANYLRGAQADITEDNAGNGFPDIDPEDGGWDWILTVPAFSHTAAASPPNIYGTTAIGLYRAYQVTSDASYFTAMTDAANAIVADPLSRSASNLIFLMYYDDLPSVAGTTYQDAAKAKFDARITAYGGATALAQYIRDARGITQGYPNGIIAWDIGAFVVVAAMLEDRYPADPYDYAQATDDMAEVIYQDSFMDNPGLFDIVDDAGWDPTYANVNYWWYTLGITGLIDAFQVSGNHTAEIPALIARVTASQYATGAVSGSYGAHEDDEDWQSTSYSAMSLGRVNQALYQLEINSMACWTLTTQDASGAYVYSNGTHYPQTAGECTAGVYFSTPDATIGPDVTGYPCLSVTSTCLADVPFAIQRVDNTPMRGFDVTFHLENLVLCDVVPGPEESITQGTYLSDAGSTYFELVDNGGGSYTVSCVILGSSTGATAASGTLFNIDVKSSGLDGDGLIVVDGIRLRDLINHPILGDPGPDGVITIDTAPLAAIANLTAPQVKSGNDFDGTTKITLNYTAPSGSDYDYTQIFRKGYGNYPEYDDPPGGAVPAVPATPTAALAAGWVSLGAKATGSTDEPATRDFWYFIAFSYDDCGNVSAVSNMTTGTLNYHLGDVTPYPDGNNSVGGPDVSRLGNTYGKSHGQTGYFNDCDAGPTTDYSVDARPTTDNVINFEDLMVFAMNYSVVGDAGASMVAQAERARLVLSAPATALKPGGEFVAHLALEGNTASVQGLHAEIACAGLELVAVTWGDWLVGQPVEVFQAQLEIPGGIALDAAALGQGVTLSGSGEVAQLRFRVLTAGATARIAVAELRNSTNRPLGASATGELTQLPTTADVPVAAASGTVLFGAQPNPFRATTDIRFRLGEATLVHVDVFDASGRLVRNLAAGTLPAGDQTIAWDGCDAQGRRLGRGVYMYTFRAGAHEEAHKLFLIR
jgi:hypothetical protein